LFPTGIVYALSFILGRFAYLWIGGEKMDNISSGGQLGWATGLQSTSSSDGTEVRLLLASVMTLAELRTLYPSMATTTFYRRAKLMITRKAWTGGTILTTIGEAVRVLGQPEVLP